MKNKRSRDRKLYKEIRRDKERGEGWQIWVISVDDVDSEVEEERSETGGEREYREAYKDRRGR